MRFDVAFAEFFAKLLLQQSEELDRILKGCSRTAPSPSHYPDGNYLEEDKYSPGFLTLGQKYSIAIGSTVVLPCKINETENSSQFVLAWKRDIAVLTAASVKVTVNPRIRLMPVQGQSEPHVSLSTGYNLEIRDVRIGDAGDYICQIGSMEPKEIVHTLEVLVPPKIDYISPANKLDVHKNALVRMECRGTGNPTPRIIWSRRNNVLPSGEPNKTGTVFEVPHANRHTSGHYKCTADNRVGQPDSREIVVNVLYPPEIEVEQQTVHSGVGHEAQLVCIVHAEPAPNVIWYKETTQLGTTEQHSQQIRGNKHSLIIRNVTRTDLGNYTCQASNTLGKDRGTLSLSGLPTVCYFESPTISSYRDQYNISWTVQSYSPIEEYRLFYRLQSASKSHLLHSNTHDKPLDNHIYSHSTYGSHSGGAGGYNPGGHIGSEQWENVVIPEMMASYNGMRGGMFYNTPYNYQPGIRHRMSFQLKNLQSGSNYEARVQARNEHGWNRLSSIFHFSTRSEDMELEPSAQPAVHGAGLLDKGLLGLGSNDAAAPYFHKSSTCGGLLLVLLAVAVAMAASQQLPLAAGGGLSA
ncbi:leucine-rich repeats and immunoglobulin-like domains protein 3 [Ochlerotatus camptorhynchus]|uniref:leucine-rich repeats and immunoglobulin-like domains protein 3 n=1 Tax=Ochlerotatus camptorhynchus TaxID=644619 RepID=UPI0031E00E48